MLDDPVKAYLPAFADVTVEEHAADGSTRRVPPRRDITIHDLLTHTAGLTYAVVHDAPREQLDLAAFVRRLCAVPLTHHPGETWQYSAAHDVLGALIEAVSGQTLDVFLQQRILGPLGMSDTAFWVTAEKRDRLAAIYEQDAAGNRMRKTVEDRPYCVDERPCFLSGGGGLVGSTSDYLRFLLMLLGRGAFDGVRVLGRKTVELMTVDHLPPGHPAIEPFKFGYGLGVSVLRSLAEKQGLGSVGEFGWGGAACTDAWVDPREEMVCLVMMQLRPSRRLLLTKKVKDAFYQAIVD